MVSSAIMWPRRFFSSPLDGEETPPSHVEAGAIERVLAGEADAFAVLLGGHRDAVYAYIHRIVGSAEDAEDLAQEAFVVAYRKLGSFDRRRPFRPWVLRIARNLAVSALRRRRPVVSMETLADDGAVPACDAPGPAEVAARNQRDRDLHAALGRLSPPDREVLHLHYFEEMSLADIATVTGRSTNAAKVALHRARRRLRDLVDAADFTNGDAP